MQELMQKLTELDTPFQIESFTLNKRTRKALSWRPTAVVEFNPEGWTPVFIDDRLDDDSLVVKFRRASDGQKEP